MPVRLAVLATMALLLAIGLTACDNFAEYTVINETDEELLTWPLLEGCGDSPAQEEDYLHTDTIEPHQTHHYFDAYSPAIPEPGCVQVATMDRRLVLSEPYEYGGTYRISKPLRPFGNPVPNPDDLPHESWRESLRETHPFYIALLPVMAIFGLAIIGASAFGLMVTVRHFWRFYVRKG